MLDNELINAFAINQAVFQAAGRNVGTGNPDNLRGMLDAALRAEYEESGTSGSRELRVNGQPVGEIGVTTTKVAVIDDADALDDWAKAAGYYQPDVRVEVKCGGDQAKAMALLELARSFGLEAGMDTRYDTPDIPKVAKAVKGQWVAKETGEVIPGVHVEKRYKGTTLRDFSAEAVARAIQGLPGSDMVASLIAGGEM